MEALSALGQLWVFLKYHHPAVAAGKYDWDAELIRELPAVLAAKDRTAWTQELERWVDRLPAVEIPVVPAPDISGSSIKLQPDYGDLFVQGYLPDSLAAKLRHILESTNITSNHYIADRPTGSPLITNEDSYAKSEYPGVGLRLLALYRYWGLIQYFFPYRHLIGEGWTEVLSESIPSFLDARDAAEYTLACLRLMARTNDGHAGIRKSNKAMKAYWGKYHPAFNVKFIEGKMVVNRFYAKAGGLQSQVSRGDVVTHIDGEPVAERLNRMLPLVPASNRARQLRDAARMILRGPSDKVRVALLHGGRPLELALPRYEDLDMSADDLPDFDERLAASGYQVLADDIGYVYAGKFENPQLPGLQKAFAKTKGMVIDLRCYPADDIAFTLGGYLKKALSPFLLITRSGVRHPGLFTFTDPVQNGGTPGPHYEGKVVVLVNEETKSAGEAAAMAFQSAPDVTVLGSATAGADGNIAVFYLPGGIYTAFSALGAYYPDRTETQREGVRVDVAMFPTLKGFREGKDELLQKAVELILRGGR